jgi:hypothetical protein
LSKDVEGKIQRDTKRGKERRETDGETDRRHRETEETKGRSIMGNTWSKRDVMTEGEIHTVEEDTQRAREK